MHQWTGFICVILAGIGFGFLGVFGKLAFGSGMTVGHLLVFRFLVAAIILFVGLGLFNRSLLKLNLKQIFISMGLGILGYAVFATLYFEAIQGLSVSLAALLLFTFPLFVNIGSHFILKEKMNRNQFWSLILAFLGIVTLLWGPIFFDSLVSIFYALSAAIVYSVYVLVSGRYQQNVHALTSSLYVILSAALALSLFHQVHFFEIIHLSGNQFFYVLGLAVICTILPISLFLFGLQRLPSSKASIVVMVEPVVAAIAAWVILDEKLRPFQYVGMALVLYALKLNVKSEIKNNNL